MKKNCVKDKCPKRYDAHHWGTKKASTDGWFFQKNGDVYCPDHVPEWVERWRERKQDEETLISMVPRWAVNRAKRRAFSMFQLRSQATERKHLWAVDGFKCETGWVVKLQSELDEDAIVTVKLIGEDGFEISTELEDKTVTPVPIVFNNDDPDAVSKAERAVKDYIYSMYESVPSDPIPSYETRLVSFEKILQNWKARLITTLNDSLYYEVTYNGDEKVLSLSVYSKIHQKYSRPS